MLTCVEMAYFQTVPAGTHFLVFDTNADHDDVIELNKLDHFYLEPDAAARRNVKDLFRFNDAVMERYGNPRLPECLLALRHDVKILKIPREITPDFITNMLRFVLTNSGYDGGYDTFPLPVLNDKSIMHSADPLDYWQELLSSHETDKHTRSLQFNFLFNLLEHLHIHGFSREESVVMEENSPHGYFYQFFRPHSIFVLADPSDLRTVDEVNAAAFHIPYDMITSRAQQAKLLEPFLRPAYAPAPAPADIGPAGAGGGPAPPPPPPPPAPSVIQRSIDPVPLGPVPPGPPPPPPPPVEGKRPRGGGKPKKNEDPAHYALSEDDIRKVAGNIPIYRYPDLAKFATPDEMFKGKKAVVLLFLTESRDDGHWLTVLDHPNQIEVFDSFGVSPCVFSVFFFIGCGVCFGSEVKV